MARYQTGCCWSDATRVITGTTLAAEGVLTRSIWTSSTVGSSFVVKRDLHHGFGQKLMGTVLGRALRGKLAILILEIVWWHHQYYQPRLRVLNLSRLSSLDVVRQILFISTGLVSKYVDTMYEIILVGSPLNYHFNVIGSFLYLVECRHLICLDSGS